MSRISWVDLYYDPAMQEHIVFMRKNSYTEIKKKTVIILKHMIHIL